MTPANMKKLILQSITQLKVQKKWNTSVVSTYEGKIEGEPVVIKFMHQTADEKTKNAYFTFHSTSLGVWLGTFHILRNNQVSIRSLKIVVAPQAVKELMQVEKIGNLSEKLSPLVSSAESETFPLVNDLPTEPANA